MAVNGKPGISTVRDVGRSAQLAFDAIRRRIEALEKLLNTVELAAGASTQKNAAVSASISFLQSQINSIISDIKELTDLLSSGEGIVVVSDGQLFVRELEAGDNITIDNSDGIDGNPVISSTAGSSSCCYPFLTTEDDDDILTESGHRIRIEG